MKWMTRGDIDGFFGLAIDNLVQLLVIDALCRGVLGFSVELVPGRILPGVAVALIERIEAHLSASPYSASPFL